MVTTPGSSVSQASVGQAVPLVITWERLPDDVPLDDEPVENTGQPLLAGRSAKVLNWSGLFSPKC